MAVSLGRSVVDEMKRRRKPSPDPERNLSEQLAGVLYVVGTPIGNLGDITLRALKTLKEVDLVACEDTRRTRQLLQHYHLSTPTTSYHEHNELTRAAELILELEQGARIALVSDAGMPGLSDPGYRLIALCIRHHLPVVPIPGASAAVAALVVSGLPTDAFRFAGFLPAKSTQRRKMLQACSEENKTLIFYEAPHRIVETLQDVHRELGNRKVVVARELTKVHEEFLRGHCLEVLEQLRRRAQARGEITLLIRGAEKHPQPVARGLLRRRVEQIMREHKLDRMAALKKVARERGISKRQAYGVYERGE